VINLDGSNSYNVALWDERAHVILVTPSASNADAREESLVVVASGPSITCTPTTGPSTLAELDALTVIN
jgi:hypothetical protein